MKARKVGVIASIAAAVGLAVMPTPEAHATGTWVYSKPIAHQYQDTSYNCVPASFVNQLYSVGVTYNQDQLAAEMGTSAANGGTYWTTAAPALNNIVKPNYVYDIRIMHASTDLLNELQYEISTFGSGIVLPTIDGKLPWVNNSADTNGHAIVLYGYNTGEDTTQGGRLQLWDPYPGRGFEEATVQEMFGTLQQNSVYEFSQEQ